MAYPPLTARSVLASTLLGTHPPVLPGRVLVRAGALFGISEGTVRVALSRMAAAGEVTAEDGSYRLAGPLLERQARQRESRSPHLRAWRGRWRQAVVVGGARSPAERAALRAAMRRLRMGDRREGVWLRPDNLDVPGDTVADAQCEWGTLVPDGDAAELASRLWDLHGWAGRAGELQRALHELEPAVAAGDRASLAPGFVVSAAVLRHLQSDPLLPPEVLPGGWPGSALRDGYDRFDHAYRTVLSDWFRANP